MYSPAFPLLPLPPGLRNKLSRLWKANQEGTASDAPYPWHSVESQMRQMGDLGFLLGQYSFAAATYRLAAGDYLNSSNNKWYAGVEVGGGQGPALAQQVVAVVSAVWCCSSLSPAVEAEGSLLVHYVACCCGEDSSSLPACLLSMQHACAAAQEMIGLCCIMDPANEQADPLKYFSRAYESYAKCPGRVNRMLATRSMMLAAAYLTSVGRHQVGAALGALLLGWQPAAVPVVHSLLQYQ